MDLFIVKQVVQFRNSPRERFCVHVWVHTYVFDLLLHCQVL